MSNVIVKPEHQSSPKETESTKVIRGALQELYDGTFTPSVTDEFFDSGISALLAQHPAVQEVLDKLEYETQSKTNAEYLEKAEQLHEVNEYLVKRSKWDGQERWQGDYNEKSRLVNLMTPTQFIEKLQQFGISAEHDPPEENVRIENPDYNPFAIVQDQTPFVDMRIVKSDKQIYLGNRVIGGRVALNAKVKNPETGALEDKRINTLQVPLGPEWSVMGFDEYGCPTHERYHGWRTALLALITNGVLTKEKAHKIFGEPRGEASLFYRKQLFEGGY